MAKNTLLYEDDSVDAKAASEFVARILHGVTMAHMHHLTTDSFSAHMALGELYEGLQDGGDELAEALMGCAGVVLKFNGGPFTLAADPIADVSALYEYVETRRGAVGSESHIQNIVDEVCSTIAKALYKLKRLG